MYLSVAQMSRFLIKCGVDYGDILLLNKLRLEGALGGTKRPQVNRLDLLVIR